MKRTLKDLKVKVFADGADKKGMLELNANPLIQGLTTNPTLMRQAGLPVPSIYGPVKEGWAAYGVAAPKV